MTNSIKAHAINISNASRKISLTVYRFFRKRWLRSSLTVMLILLALVIGLFAGKAWANPAEKPSHVSVSHVVAKRPLERSDYVSPTTTTTTIPKKRMAVNTNMVRHSSPSGSTPIVSQADWTIQCRSWLTQIGVTGADQDAAIYIIDHESDCSPTVRNPHSSAGGIPQALPFTKMRCPMEQTDEAALCQLRWMASYVNKYGGWQGAAQHRRNGNSY